MAFLENIGKTFNLTLDELKVIPQVTVFIGHGAVVEGHVGLLALRDDEIKFKLKKGTLKINGEGLFIKELDASDSTVSGKVYSVNVEER